MDNFTTIVMEKLNEILNYTFLGNNVLDYVKFLLIVILGLIFRRLFSKVSSRLLFRLFKRYSADISVEKFVAYMRKPTALLILLIFLFIAGSQLDYPVSWHLVPHSEFGLKMIVERIYLIVVISAVIWAFLRIIDVFSSIMIRRAERTESKTDNQIIPFMFEVLKVVMLIIGVFVILGTVFNLNIGSLIAGLGIGGLAVALAAKETLENLLGSFTIFLDKPFSSGDLVKVGEITGVVEKIGFRSTRIRTLEQSFVTVPNKKMVDAELDNLTQRTMQRVRFFLKLRLDTTELQLNEIKKEIKTVLEQNPFILDNPTVKLYEFSDSALEILIIYLVNTPDYIEMLGVREEINFKILSIVEKANAKIAIPAASVFMEK